MPIRDVRLQAAILRDRALLLLRCRLPSGEAFWLLPGGAREPGEALAAALAREVREELGVDVAVAEVLDDVPAEPPAGTYQHWRTYRCVLVRGEPAAQGADGVATLDAVTWLSLDAEAAWPADVRADRFLAPQLRRIREAVGSDRALGIDRPLGLRAGAVRLAPSTAAWPTAFAAEQARLRAALAALPVALEHVGSTSVPGLDAKPILDLLAGRPPEGELAPYVAAFVAAGYTYRGEHGLTGREYFVRDTPAGDGMEGLERTHHLHLVVEGGAIWRDHLAFRDYLRRVPARAAAYAALKRELAARHPTDRAGHTDGKAAFIAETLRLAVATPDGLR